MKVKQLFHQSARGTQMFRVLVDMYGMRVAVQEVNKLVVSEVITPSKRFTPTSDLCVWWESPQGHDFWSYIGKQRPNGGW